MFVLAVATASAQLRAGESAIFFRSGDVIVDRIVDISSTRHVLQTANSGEFQIREVWMINFVNENWDFPQERDQMETNENYVFLKNGDVISGRLTDFSSTRKVFQLQAGDEIAPGRIRRIYLSRQVPAGLQDQGQASGNRGAGRNPNGVRAVPGLYQAIGNNRNVELQLDQNGAARLTFQNGMRRQALTGDWAFKPGDKAIVVVSLESGGGRTVMTFGRDGDLLVGINYDKNTFGTLSLRRQ
jgi:hypothetical protein